jgi:hypothetical protein
MSTFNLIGPWLFISMEPGPPEGFAEQIAVEARSGVNGYDMWKTGQRGRPFAVITRVDPPGATIAAALAAGRARYRQYEALVGQGPQVIVWANLPETFRVIVQNVRRLGLRPVVGGKGGLNNGQAILEVEWTLIAV